MMKTKNQILIIMFVTLLSLIGCNSKTSKFYVLTPLSEVEKVSNGTLPEDLSIGVGPITLPDYVNRPQIVTKNGGNELVLDEYHRWAESLNNNVSRVLSDNFEILLGTQNINTYPWNRFVPIDYQVAIEITKFDSVVGQEVSLEARWVISIDRGRNELVRKKSKIKKAVVKEQFASIVTAKSQALADLSQEIADAINTISNSKNISKVE